jgi:hypothetical protein
MARMEQDLGTPLEWVATVHYNTERPHVHSFHLPLVPRRGRRPLNVKRANPRLFGPPTTRNSAECRRFFPDSSHCGLLSIQCKVSLFSFVSILGSRPPEKHLT